ncbi:MAG TPA: thioredoxin fold domain-containing protein [Candidatus Duodenibacillus intestinigallinarum]|nr:thioredoxin fold domain-containing protein [Candidatus Duodenibacillus intestinigallinarum]
MTVFVDPLCGWCHKLMGEVVQDEELKQDYTFDFIVIAALGDESAQLAKRLYCAEKVPERRFDLLLKGSEAIQALPEKSGCKNEALQRTAFAAQVLGVKAVPFVIAPDGRFARGKPADLRKFLEGNASDGGSEAVKPNLVK